MVILNVALRVGFTEKEASEQRLKEVRYKNIWRKYIPGSAFR